MRVLITGGTGFVGEKLAAVLVKAGNEVIVTSRSGVGSDCQGVINGIRYMRVDYSNSCSLNDTFQELQPDYIVHLASGKDRSDLLALDTEKLIEELKLGINVIHAATNLSVLKRFIFIGTSDQYDMTLERGEILCKYSPSNSYGFVKATASLLLNALHKRSQFPVVQLIPSIIYGPGQGEEMFLPSLIRSLTEGNTFAMSKGEQVRDFLYVSDFVEAIRISLFEMDDQFLGNTYTVCSGEAVRLLDVVTLVAKNTGASMDNVSVGAIEYRPGESMEFNGSPDQFIQDSGWKPMTSIEVGVVASISER